MSPAPALIERVARAILDAENDDCNAPLSDEEWARIVRNRGTVANHRVDWIWHAAERAIDALLTPYTPDDDPRIPSLLRGANDALRRAVSAEARVAALEAENAKLRKIEDAARRWIEFSDDIDSHICDRSVPSDYAYDQRDKALEELQSFFDKAPESAP